MKERIFLSAPHMGGKELDYIEDAFKTNWIAPLGPNVDGFEKDIVSFLGGDAHVTALSSGTAAIHLALVLLGVQPGDEVICQSMTCSASVNPVAYLGANPVLIDSEPDTWNMSPDFLEEAIKDRIAKGKKPKAIIPVHLFGMPTKMYDIRTIAAKYEIPIIEDAAEALGSSIDGKMCGTFGDIGIVSFNGNKIITTSGGGALISHSKKHTERALFLSTQAKDASPHYEHSSIGYNYRMSNICAGIGRGQMEVLKERVALRRNIYEQYRRQLRILPGISFVEALRESFSNRWLTTILINPEQSGGVTRETLRLAFESQNIEARPVWKPMHLQPVFQHCLYYGEGVSDKIFDHGLCLPSGSGLTPENMQRIFGVFDSVWDKKLVA